MRHAILVVTLTFAGCFGSSGEFQACAEACARQGRAMATCSQQAGCVCEAVDGGAP